MRHQPSFVANPLSREKIRNFTKMVREAMGLHDELNFPIMSFLENVMQEIDPNFYFEIVTREEMGECFGVAYPDEHKIVLREDVYNGAIEGDGMHRFTVAHEIGHFLLHGNRSVALARIDPKEKIPAYKDPEWQASCFAGELLMPAELIKNMDWLEIVDACEVSPSAARVQLRKAQ